MSIDAGRRAALARWLEDALGAQAVTIESVEQLAGGAIQLCLGLEVTVLGGPRAGTHAVVLRTDAPSALAVSWSRPQEHAVLETAWRAGVAVPEPWAVATDTSVIGRPFSIMARVKGQARGPRVVRDPAVQANGEAIAAALGVQLARLHRVRPPLSGLDFLPLPERSPMQARIEQLRQQLDAMDESQPVLEWGLRWLERHATPSTELVLTHGDCRTGNYMVEAGRLTSILDWEFAGWSDPLEDLGWLLARCWRYGVDQKECGGVGSRQSLLDAYEAEAGQTIDRPRIAEYELLASLRWAVIALMQAHRHRSGREPSLELALTAHVLPGLEAEVLDQIRLLEARR